MTKLNLKDNTPNSTIDKIPQNNSLCKYLSGRTIAKLNESENILVWPTSFKDCDDDIKDQVLFDCKFSFDGKNIEEIQTYNLIGFIGDKNTQIEIRTRFSGDAENSDYFLYYMLSTVLSCNIVDMQVGKGIESALDMMMLFFSNLLIKAVNQGIYKKYVSREYNDSNVRGTINVSRHIRHNYPSNGRVAYNTREYSYDNTVTQLIRHTIEYIKSKNEFGKKLLSANEITKKCVDIITQITPTYQKRNKRDVINANQKPIVHPHYLHYTALQKLCLAILNGEKMSYRDGKEKLNGFIIDVAWLWEEYVAKILSTTNLNHYTRSNSSFHLLSNNGATFQKIIPDYYDEEKRIVADAKYTDLSKIDNLSAERAAAIYYKTIMYMYRFNSKIGLLIHPTITNEVKDVEIIEYKIIGTDGKLCKVGIKIPSQCNDFSDFSKKMKGIESIVSNEIETLITSRNG